MNEIDHQATWSVRNALIFLALLAGFFIVWCAPRDAAISQNTLHMDDFLIRHGQSTGDDGHAGAMDRSTLGLTAGCMMPPQDRRWGLVAIHCVLNDVYPDWVIGRATKWVAGIGMALSASLLVVLFWSWHMGRVTSIAVALLFVLHPILNEIGLWNVAFSYPWLIACSLMAILLAENTASRKSFDNRVVAAITLLSLVAITYETYVMVFAVLVAARVALNLLSNQMVRPLLQRASWVLGCAVVVYIGFAIAARMFGYKGRGVADVTSLLPFLNEKLHGLFNLWVNVYMPPIAMLAPEGKAFSYWKWVPLALASVTWFVAVSTISGKSIIGRATALASLHLALPLLGALPTIVAGQSPEAWRVSVPSLIGALCAIAVTTAILSPCAEASQRFIVSKRFNLGVVGLAMGLLCAILLGLAAHAEANLRVDENEADRRTVEKIRTFWAAAVDAPSGRVRVGVTPLRAKSIVLPSLPATRMTIAYAARGVNSALFHYFSWRSYLSLQGFDYVEVNRDAWTDNVCSAEPQKCLTDLSQAAQIACSAAQDVDSVNQSAVVHFELERMSIICRP